MSARVDSTTATSFYEGVVRHRRRLPVPHSFEYRVFFLYLDLAEADHLLDRPGLWSMRRFAPARFRRDDYWGDPDMPLDAAVRDLVERRLGFRPTGPVRLLTNLRTFGFLMNPVSFYYCFAADGATLEALVAAVTNTPWGERYCYVLDLRDGPEGAQRAATRKMFHVSPFLEMNYAYRWRFNVPGRSLALAIELEPTVGVGAKTSPVGPFRVSLILKRREFSRAQRLRMLVRYPWQTLRIAAAIYLHALRLWWKGVRFVPHPGQHGEASAGKPSSPRRTIIAAPVNAHAPETSPQLEEAAL